MEIRFFHADVEEFIRGLEKPTIAKVLRTIDLLETFGHKLGMPHSKAIGENYLSYAFGVDRKFG
ncbi:MAG TPA: hypothetical protein VJB99_04710 [Patescibacteria group bacterium]|nr:hypothetical protein [Patescibacteria group bacterium]